MLPIKLEYDSMPVTTANDLANRWDASRDVDDPPELDFKPSDLDKLNSKQRNELFRNDTCPGGPTTGQTAVFLERLDTFPALPTSHIFHLDGLYRFSQTKLQDSKAVLPCGVERPDVGCSQSFFAAGARLGDWKRYGGCARRNGDVPAAV